MPFGKLMQFLNFVFCLKKMSSPAWSTLIHSLGLALCRNFAETCKWSATCSGNANKHYSSLELHSLHSFLSRPFLNVFPFCIYPGKGFTCHENPWSWGKLQWGPAGWVAVGGVPLQWRGHWPLCCWWGSERCIHEETAFCPYCISVLPHCEGYNCASSLRASAK